MSTAKSTHTLTTKHVMKSFGIGQVTTYLWRQGTKTREPMPCKVEKTGRANNVSYSAKELTAWAKKNKVEIVVPFEVAATENPAHKGKTGPKPASAPSKQNKSNVGGTNGSGKPVATKVVAKKPAAKKVPAKKVPAKKVPTKKPSVKTAPAQQQAPEVADKIVATPVAA